jgi:hypothetical protein
MSSSLSFRPLYISLKKVFYKAISTQDMTNHLAFLRLMCITFPLHFICKTSFSHEHSNCSYTARQMVLEKVHDRVAKGVTQSGLNGCYTGPWTGNGETTTLSPFQHRLFPRIETNARCFLWRQDNPEVNYRATWMFR